MSETIGYERIWLQRHDTDAMADAATWCQHRIDDDDVEYVRADLVAFQVRQAVDAERVAAAVKAWRVCDEQALRDQALRDQADHDDLGGLSAMICATLVRDALLGNDPALLEQFHAALPGGGDGGR